jgi:hypothetical protein
MSISPEKPRGFSTSSESEIVSFSISNNTTRVTSYIFYLPRSSISLYLHLPTTNFRFDYLATKTHAIIVPSCGIDSVPADVSVHLASKTLGHSPLGTSMTSAGLSGGFPGGTIATFITACEDVPFNHLLLSSHDWSLSPVPGARSPTPSLVYRLGPGSRIVGGIGLFGRVNRALVQRTAGLREFAHREARLSGRGGGDVRAGASYGPAFTYTEFTPTGNTFAAFMLSLALGFSFAAITFFAPVCISYFPQFPIRTEPIVTF